MRMHDDFLAAATTISFSSDQELTFQVNLNGGAHGHLALPQTFKNNTFYMISGWNPGDKKVGLLH